MKPFILLLFFISALASTSCSQEMRSLNKASKAFGAEKEIKGHTPQKDIIFPERCLGVWEGIMYIYRYNDLLDSVQLRFTAAKTDVDSIYTWKKEYLSPTRPMVKDYKLVVDDVSKGRYILDEGDGVELIEYNVNNKLYSLFQVDNLYLTSSTELVDGKIIFEVTSGKKENEVKGIQNYSFTNVQRAVLYKVDE